MESDRGRRVSRPELLGLGGLPLDVEMEADRGRPASDPNPQVADATRRG
jgi:hypothetical protein